MNVDKEKKLCYPLHNHTIYDLSARKGDASDGNPGKRILYVDVHANDAALDLPDHAFVRLKTPRVDCSSRKPQNNGFRFLFPFIYENH